MNIAVCGGKGGVGKSTVAVNLGAAMDGVVVDCDLTMANLPRGRGPDLHDVLDGDVPPRAAVRSRGGVDILPCGRSLSGAADSDPTALVDTIEALERTGQPVILDCPAGLRADVGLPLAIADRFVPVTTTTRSAVADALRTRGVATGFEAGLAGVVVNKVSGDVPFDRIERVFGAPATAIPDTHRLAGTVEDETPPLVTRAPDSPAGRRLQALGNDLRQRVRHRQ